MAIQRSKNPVICLCNGIKKDVILKAIEEGQVTNTDELYDQTGAGVGPCGGTCRAKTLPLIEYYLKNKKFPPSES